MVGLEVEFSITHIYIFLRILIALDYIAASILMSEEKSAPQQLAESTDGFYTAASQVGTDLFSEINRRTG